MSEAVELSRPIEGVVETGNGRAIVPTSVLSPERAARLEECEEIIDRGLLTFQEVGNALRTIQSEKLWVDHYGSFDDYLDQRWGFKASYANQIIRAVDDSKKLVAYAHQNDKKGQPFPTNAEQFHVLEAFRTDGLKWEAWTRAVDMAEGEQPTIQILRTVVAVMKAEREPGPPLRASVTLKGRGTITIGLPLDNAARAMREFYTYTELRALSLLIKQKG